MANTEIDSEIGAEKNKEEPATTSQKLFRPEVNRSVAQVRQKLSSGQSFNLVDRLLFGSLLIVLVTLTASHLVHWHRHQIVHGILRFGNKPVLIPLQFDAGRITAIEVSVADGQAVEVGDVLAHKFANNSPAAIDQLPNNSVITSPVSGMVTHIELPNPQLSNRSPLIVIQPTNSLQAEFVLPAAWSAKIKIHQRLHLYTSADILGQERYGEITQTRWMASGNIPNSMDFSAEHLLIIVSLPDGRRGGSKNSSFLAEGTPVDADIGGEDVSIATLFSTLHFFN